MQVAELVLDEQGRDEFLNVSAGLAVLAGVAASDAICATRLGKIPRGQDHRDAAKLLEQAVANGRSLAQTFLRLIDMKDEAHYGVFVVAPRRARDAVKWARRLVEAAQAEVER
jgi:hypothetical protein